MALHQATHKHRIQPCQKPYTSNTTLEQHIRPNSDNVSNSTSTITATTTTNNNTNANTTTNNNINTTASSAQQWAESEAAVQHKHQQQQLQLTNNITTTVTETSASMTNKKRQVQVLPRRTNQHRATYSHWQPGSRNKVQHPEYQERKALALTDDMKAG